MFFFCYSAVTLPGKVYFSDKYLEKTIRRVTQGCVENGIWNALRSSADHFQKINALHQKIIHPEPNLTSGNDPHYEFAILIVGYCLSAMVFGVELLVEYCCKNQ